MLCLDLANSFPLGCGEEGPAGQVIPGLLSAAREDPGSLNCSISHIGMYWFLLCALGFTSQPGEVT